MSDLGDTFKAWGEAKKEKRWSNYESSIRNLENANIPFRVCNAATSHLLVCNDIDFWPTTGKWRRRTFNHMGRGVRNLINYVRRAIRDEQDPKIQAQDNTAGTGEV